MSLSTTLDVIIGLAFTYLLLGIIASGVQEIFVALVNKRGKALQAGIAQLLSTAGTTNLHSDVLSHSLISDLSQKNRPPSYVPARNFALAVLDTLRAGGRGPLFSEIEKAVAALPAGSAKQSLTTFITDAAGDLAALQKSIETWFDDAMDRVSGVYKRFSQYFTLGFGLAAAILFNVDSINLAHTLWTNDDARKQFVTAAQQFEEQQKKDSEPQKKAGGQAPAAQPAASAPTGGQNGANDAAKTQKAIDDAAKRLNQLPIGWASGDDRSAWQIFVDRLFKTDGSGLWILVGWVITALATSLGAPFWFDALNNLLQLRNAGPKPKRSDEPAGKS